MQHYVFLPFGLETLLLRYYCSVFERTDFINIACQISDKGSDGIRNSGVTTGFEINRMRFFFSLTELRNTSQLLTIHKIYTNKHFGMMSIFTNPSKNQKWKDTTQKWFAAFSCNQQCYKLSVECKNGQILSMMSASMSTHASDVIDYNSDALTAKPQLFHHMHTHAHTKISMWMSVLAGAHARARVHKPVENREWSKCGNLSIKMIRLLWYM